MKSKDRVIPTVRVDDDLYNDIEWTGRHMRIHNKSMLFRRLLRMSVQLYKIIVHDQDWQVTEAQTVLDSLTKDQRERVIARYIEEIGEDSIKRLRDVHQRALADEENILQREMREREKQDRLAEAKVKLLSLDMTPERVRMIYGYSFGGEEDRALQELTHKPLSEEQIELLSPAFRQYLASLQRQPLTSNEMST